MNTGMGMRLVCYGEDGVTQVADLPDVQSVDVGFGHPSGSGLAFKVPRVGRGVPELLSDQARWVAVELWDGRTGSWVEPDDARYLVASWDGDEGEAADVYAVTCVSPDWLLTRLTWRAGGEVDARPGERGFVAASAGGIMRALVDEAIGRGALSKYALDVSSWTASVDSTGKPWSLAVSMAFKHGAHGGATLQALVDQGMVTRRWRGTQLRLLDADGPFSSTPVAELVAGREITEAPVKVTRAEVATVALVRGDDGVTVEVVDAAGVGRWGRLETSIDASGVTDPGSLTALGEALLTRLAVQREEHTHGLALAAAAALPMIDYVPGDMVRSVTSQGVREYRVRSVALSMRENGVVEGHLILNDRIAEFEERITRKVAGLSGGAGVSAGTGAMPVPPTSAEGDSTVPNPPTGLMLDSEVYHNTGPVGSSTWATVKATWTNPTHNTDGSVCNDLASIDFECRSVLDPRWRPAVGEPGRRLGSVDPDRTVAAWSPFWPEVAYEVRARARDKVEHVSTWTPWVTLVTGADTTPPPVPSAPSVALRLGVAVVTWDGEGSAGEGLPADWSHAVVHVEYVDGPELVTRTAGTMSRDSLEVVIVDIPYGVEAEVWLTSVDQSGNESARGAGVTFTPEPLVDVEPTITELDAAKVTIKNAQLAWWDASTTLTAKLDQLKTETLAAAGRPVVSTVDPVVADGSGQPTGSTWTVIDAAGALVRMWRWDGSAWVDLPLSTSVIPKIDIGVGTAGTLDVGRLSASTAAIGELVADRIWSDVVSTRKIAASQITVGSSSRQLFSDPGFVDPVFNALRSGLKLNTSEGALYGPVTTNVTGSSRKAFNVTDSNQVQIKTAYLVSAETGAHSWGGQAYACAPGDWCHVQADVAVESGPRSDGVIPPGERWSRLAVAWVGAGGSMLSVSVAPAGTDGHTATTSTTLKLNKRLSWAFPVPAGATGLVPMVQFAPLAWSSYVLDGVDLRVTASNVSPYLDASVIEGGSITTAKLAALAVTADKIAALAITSDKIAANAIQAGHIEAGSITGLKIAGGAIDGKVITGAVVRSSSDPNTGVYFNSDGLGAKRNGIQTFWLSASTGTLDALGEFRAVNPGNTSIRARLTAQAYSDQPGILFESNSGYAFQGALVSKSAQDPSYRAGAVALHGAEQSLNVTGRSELVIEPGGQGWSLQNQRGPYYEAGVSSYLNDVRFSGRLGMTPKPIFDAYQVGPFSLGASSALKMTITWGWPDDDQTYQVVTASTICPSGEWPYTSTGLAMVTRSQCTVITKNLDGNAWSGCYQYVMRMRKSR